MERDRAPHIASLALVATLAAGGGSWLLDHPGYLHVMGLLGAGMVGAGAVGALARRGSVIEWQEKQAAREREAKLRREQDARERERQRRQDDEWKDDHGSTAGPRGGRKEGAVPVVPVVPDDFEVVWQKDDGSGRSRGGAGDVIAFFESYMVLLDEFCGEVPEPGSRWRVGTLGDGVDHARRIVWVEPETELEPAPDAERPSLLIDLRQTIEVRWRKDRKGPGVVAYHHGLAAFPDRSYVGPPPEVDSMWTVEIMRVLEDKRVMFVMPIAPTTSPGRPRPPRSRPGEDVLKEAAALLKEDMTSELQLPEDLEATLCRSIIGQERAIAEIVKELRRNFAVEVRRGPITVLFLVGPTGTGKTETMKLLSDLLGFHFEKLDMGDYQERHTAIRLIGAPPSYIGSDQGGHLTRAVRAHPKSLVLFDEIEKAHADVYKSLLSVMDEGRLKDGSDNKVDDFSKCILAFTSNLAHEDLATAVEAFGNDGLRLNTELLKVLKATGKFAPEWFGRIQRVVYFKAFAVADELALILKCIHDTAGSVLVEIVDIPAAVLAHIKKLGGGAEFGARTIQGLVKEALLDILIPYKGKRVRLELKDGTIIARPA